MQRHACCSDFIASYMPAAEVGAEKDVAPCAAEGDVGGRCDDRTFKVICENFQRTIT